MRASSSAVGARFAVPITARRIVLCPARIRDVDAERLVVERIEIRPNGHGPPPSGPPSASVTPCIAALCASGMCGSGSRCACRSMKPGATISPRRVDRPFRRCRRNAMPRSTRTTRSPTIATSPRKRGAPVPSMIVPLAMTMSYCRLPARQTSSARRQAAAIAATDRLRIDSIASMQLHPKVKSHLNVRRSRPRPCRRAGHRRLNPSTSAAACASLTPQRVKSSVPS